MESVVRLEVVRLQNTICIVITCRHAIRHVTRRARHAQVMVLPESGSLVYFFLPVCIGIAQQRGYRGIARILLVDQLPKSSPENTFTLRGAVATVPVTV